MVRKYRHYSNGKHLYFSCIILFCTAVLPAYCLGADPVSWYRLDESSGTIAADSSGNSRDGTLTVESGEVISNGFIWHPAGGTSGGAIEFDGDGLSNENPRPAIVIPTSGMSASQGTVAMWAKLASTAPANDDGRNSNVYFFGLYSGSADRVQLSVGSTATLKYSIGSFAYTGTGGFAFTRGQWYHLAITWKAGSYVVYINGSAEAPYSGDGTYTAATFDTLPATADIGNHGEAGKTMSMHGMIDDVRIYDSALTSSEINHFYGAAGDPIPTDGASNVGVNTDLKWSAGEGATSYSVYFGTTNPPPFVSDTASTVFEPGTMIIGITYYWRIDSLFQNRPAVQGSTWSFTAGDGIPVADFSAAPTAGGKPLTVSFISNCNGDISSWSWDFGDGQTSSLVNPAHIYTTEGTYTVSLTVTGPLGSDTEAKNGYIKVYISEPYRLAPWQLGFNILSRTDSRIDYSFRFYEHFLWRPPTYTDRVMGYQWYDWAVSPDGMHIENIIPPDRTDAACFELYADATPYGADLTLIATNAYSEPFMDVTGIIPCLQPNTPEFSDGQNDRTWYYGYNVDGSHIGWELSKDPTFAQAMHFNFDMVPALRLISPDLSFSFWDTAEGMRFATEGIMTRESRPDIFPGWQAAVAWDHYLTAEGNNPRDCCHLGPLIGPLAPGESKVLKGKIYIVKATKEELFEMYLRDFGPSFNPADINEDGVVDLADFAELAAAWNATPSSSRWNPDCDINEPADNIIDTLDLKVFMDNWLAGY